jgi:tRNA threonylcarbamoyladenosine biosynthesis protein TsaB
LPLVVLGIETSDDFVGAGIADRSGILISKSADSHRRNKNLLNDLLAITLKFSNLTIADIDGVSVSLGPGSFTGLRVGLAAAKGICWSKKIPLAGVPSTEVIIASVSLPRGKYITVKDARRDQYYFGAYECDGSKYLRILPDSVASPERILELVSNGYKLIGRADQLRESELYSKDIIEYDPADLGGVAAKLGRDRLMAGESLDMASVSPLYIRNPGIGKVAV